MSLEADLASLITVAQSKKRIVFLLTKAEQGGAYRFVSLLLNSLNPQEFEVTLLIGSEGNPELTQALPTFIKIIEISNLRRNPNILSDLKSVWEVRSHLKRLKPDIFFLNSSKAGFIGSLASKFTRMSLPDLVVIYRIGGWTFNDPWPAWKKFFYQTLEKVSARWKDHIIVNSTSDYDQAQQLNIRPRNSLHLIHNGIDPYLEFLSREEARNQLSSLIGEQPKYLLGTIANFYPTKGLDILLKAAQQFPPEASVVIIGDGPERATLEKLRTELNLEKRVFFAGALPDAHRYIPAFDILVLPSRKEGFPWVTLEAMAAKVPVIATHVGAVPELITDGVTGYIIPINDPASMATRVTELLADERLQQEMPIQAHQNILKNFNLKTMLDKYRELFLKAL